jgi:hypothetical protein
MHIANLRIEIAGWPINEHRISDRDLELRTFDSSAQSFPDQRSIWRRLTANELLLHLRLETVVAQWFLQKIREVEAEMAEQEFQRAA